MVEDNAALIAACLPTMGALIRKRYPGSSKGKSDFSGAFSFKRVRSDKYRVESQISETPLDGPSHGSSEAYAMRFVDDSHDPENIPVLKKPLTAYQQRL